MEQDAKMQEAPPKSDESIVFKPSLQSSSSVEGKTLEGRSEDQTVGSDCRPLRDPKGTYFPHNSHETDERARKILTDFQRDQDSRVQNPSLLLEDLRELGVFSELSEDKCHFIMPFEDVNRLVMTMRMAELVLNDTG